MSMIEKAGFGVNDAGHLEMGGIDLIELSKELRTPLYIMDEAKIRDNCKRFIKAMEHYPGQSMVCYASKAFCCKYMCRIAKEEGMGLDVVSGGELFTALSVEFPVERICFHGSNKTEEELIQAITRGIGRIVVDNFTELSMLSALANKHNKTASVMLRLKPGIDPHTHEFISTGQIDSRFGFAIETGEAKEAVRQVLSNSRLKFKGIHCHIGSQILEVEPFQKAADIMLRFMKEIRDEYDLGALELNLGGGYGVSYKDSDEPVSIEEIISKITDIVVSVCRELVMDPPTLLLEPGRAIVGAAGLTLYTAGGIKVIPDVRKYVLLDGGMTDNPRHMLYGAEYTAVVANKADQPATECVTLAGKTCESGDMLGKDMMIQPVETGDIIAVLSTGAYNYSMAMTYNRTVIPQVVMIRNGRIKTVVKRGSYEDLMRHDM